jgi:hypothetical protein
MSEDREPAFLALRKSKMSAVKIGGGALVAFALLAAASAPARAERRQACGARSWPLPRELGQ